MIRSLMASNVAGPTAPAIPPTPVATYQDITPDLTERGANTGDGGGDVKGRQSRTGPG